MSREFHGAPLVRCLTVWLLTTAAPLVLLLGLGPELHAARELADPAQRAGVPFDALLTTVAAMVLTACALWFWAVTTVVLGQAMTGRLRSVRGCPDGVRRLVLAACGLALVATAAPAAADSTAGRPPEPDDRHAVSGLPLPDRAAIGPGSPEPRTSELGASELGASELGASELGASELGVAERGAARPGVVHLVRSGDTLWGIAADSLPGSATDADVDQRWRDIWAANRTAIGPDPDLIHPGTTMHLPLGKES